MISFKSAFVVCAFLAMARAVPAPHNAIQTEDDLLNSIYTDCLHKDSYACLKIKLFNFVDKMLGHKDTITVTEGVQIVKTGDEPSGAPRSISTDDSIENILWNRLSGFLDTHTLKINLKGSEIVSTISSSARSFNDVVDSLTEEDNTIETGADEARGKKKKAAKILGPLLAAAALKAAVLGKLALAGIALIAGKALLIGKVALVLSAIIGLKKLLGSGKHVTYEVVSHPQHSSSHVTSHETVYGGSAGGFSAGDSAGYSSGGSAHGGWGRSLDAQQLAYRGHKVTQQ